MKDNVIDFPASGEGGTYNEPATLGEVIELAQQVSILHDEIQELSKLNNRLIKLIAKQSAEIADLRKMILLLAQGQGNEQPQ